jgi:hypothetical protein
VMGHAFPSSRSLGYMESLSMTESAIITLIARFFYVYSLGLFFSNIFFQVITGSLPHNLQIVDYVAGIVGSIHNSTAFAMSYVAEEPNLFFSANEWMWADSAYPCYT